MGARLQTFTATISFLGYPAIVTPFELILLAVVVFAAACLQGSIGFGLGMLAAPFVTLVDPTLLPASVIMLAIAISGVVAVLERRALDLRGTSWALLGRVPGSAIGAFLVSVLTPGLLAWVVALTVLFGVVVSLRGWHPRVTRTSQMVAGAASGIMGTATSIGGAPMAMVWQGSESSRYRGSMSAFFLVGSLLSLVALLLWGAISAETLRFVAWMLPAALAGTLVSRRLNRHLNRTRIRYAALGAASFGAVILILTQAWELVTR